MRPSTLTRPARSTRPLRVREHTPRLDSTRASPCRGGGAAATSASGRARAAVGAVRCLGRLDAAAAAGAAGVRGVGAASWPRRVGGGSRAAAVPRRRRRWRRRRRAGGGAQAALRPWRRARRAPSSRREFIGGHAACRSGSCRTATACCRTRSSACRSAGSMTPDARRRRGHGVGDARQPSTRSRNSTWSTDWDSSKACASTPVGAPSWCAAA